MSLKRKTLNKGNFFDSELYLDLQSKSLFEKINTYNSDVVYIEFGGKIFDDMHASRVLPGYYPDMKIRIMKKLLPNVDFIFAVSAKDIERRRLRGDHRLTYDHEAIRVIKELNKAGIVIKNVSITRITKENVKNSTVLSFKKKLEIKGITVLLQSEMSDLSTTHDIFKVIDTEEYVKTKKRFVVILSPGGGSGKFGVCLSQLYHEMKDKKVPYYIKFGTFPVHDLFVNHPLNLAYMAASADFYDLVSRDPRHLKRASSYNRDIENYELLHSLARTFKKEGVLLRKITSATNMGVNILSKAILNWEGVEKEAAAEICRRLIRHKYEVKNKEERPITLLRVKNILTMLCEAN